MKKKSSLDKTSDQIILNGNTYTVLSFRQSRERYSQQSAYQVNFLVVQSLPVVGTGSVVLCIHQD